MPPGKGNTLIFIFYFFGLFQETVSIRWTSKDLKGSDLDLIEVTSRHLPGRTEQNCEEYLSGSHCPRRDSKWGSPEYKFGSLAPWQPARRLIIMHEPTRKENNFIYPSQSRGTERHSLHLIVANCATRDETFLTLLIHNCFLSFLCCSNVDKVKWSQTETARRSQPPTGRGTETEIAVPDYRKQEPCLLERNFEEVSEMKEQHWFVLCDVLHNWTLVETECGEII